MLVLIPGIGTGRLTHGAQRWIRIGSFQFQPSEIAKVGIILYLPIAFQRKKTKWPHFVKVSYRMPLSSA